MSNSYKDMMDKAVPGAELIRKTKRKMLQKEKTVNTKTHFIRKPLPAVAAIIIIISILAAGFAFANSDQIINLLGGGRIESGKTNDGDDYISISTSFTEDPVEIINGRVYFILDGSGVDITEYCTETTFYEYEYISVSGYRHVVIVGGAPDKLGWGEFIWDEKGSVIGNNATFHEDINGEKPQWLRSAEEKFSK